MSSHYLMCRCGHNESWRKSRLYLLVLRCRWGHNEGWLKSRFVPVGTKVSLGTQRLLCSDAQ